MTYAPAAGAILYHVRPGDRVKAGDLLVEILTAPGEEGGSVPVRAAQDGLILTRRSHRITTPGDDLLKLLGSARSATAKPGALEILKPILTGSDEREPARQTRTRTRGTA